MTAVTRWLARKFPLSPRQRAVKAYVSVLPRRLFSDYGHTGPYTPAQVESTISRYKLGRSEYAGYALALFCDGAALAHLPHHKKIDQARGQIASEYFGGDYGFSYGDVTTLCASHAGHAGSARDGGACGSGSHEGFGGHDGGGGHH